MREIEKANSEMSTAARLSLPETSSAARNHIAVLRHAHVSGGQGTSANYRQLLRSLSSERKKEGDSNQRLAYK